MNNKLKKFGKSLIGKNGIKNLVISIVILIEIIAIAGVGAYAWVETVSSIKIATESNKELEVDSYVFTEATIGGAQGTVNLGKYFKQAGDMHFSPASSADGVNMFFPKMLSNGTGYVNSGSHRFRKGNTSDMNTAYLSVSFKLRADTNADFFFEQVPTFSNQSANMRVSVTAYTEGLSDGDLYDNTGKPLYTKLYATSASSTAVVNNVNGSTGTTSVEAFSSHIKGTGSSNRLFAVGANETKIVTIKVWLQGTTMNNSLPQNISITNFGITSSLTPRHVTLLPTPTWDISGAQNQTFYAWCWNASNGDADRLYKLDLDADEHYSFDYNGTYQKTLFFRCGNPNLTTADMGGNWANLGLWNKTADTTIPVDPVDPTYIIETISGGSYDGDIGGNKSTGSWHDPATIKVATATGQSSWGNVSATSYRSASVNASEVIERTSSTSQKHKDTVHAWPGKAIQLNATVASSNYAFVGWYDNEGCTGTAVSTSAIYSTTAPSTASEVTYYAKFKEIRSLTIYKYVDGSSSSTAAGTITIGGQTSGSGVTSYSRTFDKGSSVSFSATAATGYTLEGIFTTATGTTQATSPVTLNNNTTYYARFTTNSYNVTAHAYYSTNGGSSYTADSSTGGTVKVGSATAGATSTASVKYKSSVNLVAAPASGYEFDGWYDAASGGTKLSSNTTYSYTLSTVGAKNVYARFIGENWAIKYGVHGGSNWSTVNMSVSGNNVTGTMTLTEGQDFSFKITKTIGSTTTWYGGGGSYSDITSTSFISNLSMSTTGEDTYMKGHAGTYTFTFNKSTNKLSVTASYSNITITLDYSAQSWWGNDNAVISFYDGSGESNMSNVANQTKKTISVSSTRGNSGNVGFNRWNNASHSTFWNNVDAGHRGYSTTYKIGSGWQ